MANGVLERIREFTMPHGLFEHRATWLRQEGEMRFSPDGRWMAFEAEQWFEGSGIDFRWKARVRMTPLVRASVLDAFEGGRGKLVARVLGIPIARASGPATDRGEALRGLAELPWRPAAFWREAGFTWEEVSATALRATFDDGAIRASIDLDVDGEGRVVGASAPSRPRMVGKSVVENAWSGRFDRYRTFDGLRVPTAAEVSWLLPDGPFTYWRGEVRDFRVVR